jgi:hypothetical protein
MSSATQEVLRELRQLKKAVAQLAGTADLPEDQQLSSTVLEKAAKQFHQLQAKRDQWVSASDIGKYIKGAGWWNHKILQEQLGFTAFIKIGRDFYYDKEQLKLLRDELKKRNVLFEQFCKLLESEKLFDSGYRKLKEQVRTNKTKKFFVIPDWLRDISSTPVKLPEKEVVQADIDQLQQEFIAADYKEYIDVYKGTHAMLKFIYPYEKYLEPGLRRKLSHWCDRFNTASKVLTEITGKKHKFIPAPPEDLIEL